MKNEDVVAPDSGGGRQLIALYFAHNFARQ
jgi:hypothetical protein